MSAALATAVPRLRKLVLMLSSDHDAEIIASVRAIGRLLKDAGADWHSLADSISLRHDAQGRQLPLDWLDMARACRSQAHRLTPREFDFINNLAIRQREPTDKQLAWLRAIYRRFGDGA